MLLDGSAQRGHFIELHETVEFIVAVGLPDFDVKPLGLDVHPQG
ncbi:hypothetical protein [Verminephrobacter eiseniae]|nr:hypothetical protein [Verminephrobacter eiseniae]